MAEPNDRWSFRRAWEEARAQAADMLSGAARGAGPATAGAIAGAPLGPLGSLAGAAAIPASDLATAGINRLFGSDIRPPSQAILEWLDRSGLAPAPQTGAGRFLQTGTNAAANSLAMTGIANQIAQAAGMAPTAAQNVATQMAQQPIANAAAAYPSTAAQESTSAALRARGMNPALADAIAMSAGLAADLGFSGLATGAANRMNWDDPIVGLRTQQDRAAGNMRDILTDEMGVRVGVDEATGVRGVQFPERELLEAYDSSTFGQLDQASQLKGQMLRNLTGSSNPPVNTSQTTGIIDEILTDATPEVARELQAVRNSLRGSNLEQVDDMLEYVDSLSRSPDIPDSARRELDRVYMSLQDEAADYVGQEADDISRGAWVEATRAQRNYTGADRARLINEIASRPANNQSEKAIRRLIRPEQSTAQFEGLWSSLDPDARELVRSSIYGSMLEQANPLQPSARILRDVYPDYQGKLNIINAGRPEAQEFMDSAMNVINRVVGMEDQLGGRGQKFVRDLRRNDMSKLVRASRDPKVREQLINLGAIPTGSENEVSAINSLLRQLYIADEAREMGVEE